MCRAILVGLVWVWLALPALAGGWLAPLSDGVVLPLPSLDPELPAPPAVLGGPLGEGFSRHDQLLTYLERLAEASPRVSLQRYGETYEGRPLVLLAISDEAHIGRLEELRRRHLERLTSAAPVGDEPVVVWLGYGVHGNESSSAEAAMGVAYVLAAAQDESWRRYLRQVVVLIDPLSNPDGRERYVHGYQQRRGLEADPQRDSFEHSEAWPSGRFNHYLFDLNRDWAWATQRETRARLPLFRAWEPQVHVDLHEMGSGSTYFFPPPADPIHPAISPRVVEWLETFGRSNAEAFDRHGWLFYKAQRYDLFYPAYGDSYPSLGGAVGMTYEMAGGGRAGAVLERQDGTRLTLADRIARHMTTSLATIETAAANREALLRDFRALRRASAGRAGGGFVWRADQPEAEVLAQLLARHGIQVSRLTTERRLTVRPLEGGVAEARLFPVGSLTVATAQPLGLLAEALLEGETALGEGFVERQRERLLDELEPEFYDITAWSLPLAFNLKVWRGEDRNTDGTPVTSPKDRSAFVPMASPAPEGEGRVGFLMPPQGLAGYRFAAALRGQGIHHRLALGAFSLEGRELPAGTLFVPRRGNAEGLKERLAQLAAEHSVALLGAESSYSDHGISLGSEEMVRVRSATVGLVTGDGVSPTSVGALWHLFDEVVGLGHHRFALEGLADRLAGLDVVVLPDGNGYGDRLGEKEVEALGAWVRAGGTLVAIGEAADWLREAELSKLEEWQPGETDEKGNPDGVGEEADKPSGPKKGAAKSDPEAALRERSVDIPGAMLRTRLRLSHPLAAGLASPPPTLYRGSTVLLAEESAEGNVLLVDEENPVVAGLVWPEVRERLAGSLLVGDERLGGGRIVTFAQDPVFRGLWRGTMPLLLNAVMFAPSFP